MALTRITSKQVLSAQNLVGAVQVQLDNKLRESVSVSDFGASVSASAASNSLAIQAALDSGANRVVFSEMYPVASQLHVTSSNIELCGPGGIDGTLIDDTSGINETGPAILTVSGVQRLVTTATSDIRFGNYTVTLASTTGIAPGDTLTIVSGTLEAIMDTTGALWYQSQFGSVATHDHNVVRKVSGLTVTLSWPVRFNFSVATYGINVEVNAPATDIKVSGLALVSTKAPNIALANGQGLTGVKLLRCRNVDFKGSSFSGLQGYAVFAARSFFTSITACDIFGLPLSQDYVENVASGYSGFTTYRSYGTAVVGCKSFRARHLQDATYSARTAVTGCVASNSHRAPFRTHQGCRDTVWSGNVGDGAGGILNGGWDITAVSNVLTTNTLDAAIGDGHVGGSDPTGGDIAKVHASYRATSNVTGNTLTALNRFDTTPVPDGYYEIGGLGVQMGGVYQNLVVANNAVNGYLRGINVRAWVINGAAITGNAIRAYSGSSPSDDNRGVGVRFEYSDNNYLRKNISIANNVCGECYGGGVEFSGSGPLYTPADCVIISGNIATGTAPSIRLYLGYYGEQVRVLNNLQDSGTVVGISSPGNFLAYPELHNPSSITTASSSQYEIGTFTTNPNSFSPARTVREGAFGVNSNPAPSGEYAWVATNTGTTGVLVGVTAATTAGSATVTFNTVTGVFVGCWVNVLGVDARVATLNTSTRVATLSATVASTNAAAAVIYRTPNFKSVATLPA